MSIFTSFRISGSALTAQRLRMDVIAGNIANAETTRSPEGGPYRARRVVFQTDSVAPVLPGQAQSYAPGVVVSEIRADAQEPRRAYDPGHPDADAEGFVASPNVDVVTEMVDLLSATRSYEANVTVINTAKAMAQRALDIGRG